MQIWEISQKTEHIIVCNKPHPHIICILLQSYNNVFWKVKVHEHIETILLDPAIIFFNFLCRRAFIIIMTFSVFNKVKDFKLWLYHSIFLDKKKTKLRTKDIGNLKLRGKGREKWTLIHIRGMVSVQSLPFETRQYRKDISRYSW